MSRLEDFRPQLYKSELFFHKDKAILKSGSQQAIVSVQALHFLVYFNGQHTLKEIIEKNYSSKKTFHFGMLIKTLIQLKEKNILENGKMIDRLSTQSSKLKWFTDLKPFYKANIPSIFWKFSSPLLFITLSIVFIFLSLWGIFQLPVYEAFTGFFMAQESYWKGVLSLFVCLSLLLNFKSLIQLLLQLCLLGRAYNVKAVFNVIGGYLQVDPDSIFLSPNKHFTGFYFLCGICSYFLFSLIVQHLQFDLWIFHHAHLVTLVLFIFNLNPIGNSDTAQIFKLLYDDENFNKISHLFKNHAYFLSYGKNNLHSPKLIYNIHLLVSLLWILIALTGIHYYLYENKEIISQSLLSSSVFDISILYISLIISLTVIFTLITQFIQIFYFHILFPIVQSLLLLTKRYFSFLVRQVKEYDKDKLLKQLQTLTLFKLLKLSSLKKIINQGAILKYKNGDQIISQGEIGKDIFVLLDGKLHVRQKTLNSSKILGTLNPISIFGESAFVENKHRMAEVVSIGESTTFKIEADFIKKATPHSSNIKELEDFRNFIAVDQFFSSSIFRNISRKAIYLLKEKGSLTRYHTHDTIFNELQLGEYFHLIIRGSVGIYKDTELLNQIKQGSFFGEISLMSNISRIISAKALDNLLLLNINREDFWKILSENLELAILIESIGKIRIHRIQESIQSQKRYTLEDITNQYDEYIQDKNSNREF